MGEFVPVWSFLLVVLGQFASAVWFIATLKAQVGNLAEKVNHLDSTLKELTRYDTRIALLEASITAAHKRIDDARIEPSHLR